MVACCILPGEPAAPATQAGGSHLGIDAATSAPASPWPLLCLDPGCPWERTLGELEAEVGLGLLHEPPGSRCLDGCPGKPVQHQLLWQAGYWRAQHREAMAREQGWRDRIAELEAEFEQRTAEVSALQGEVRKLQQQLFGRKSEKGKPGPRSSGTTDEGKGTETKGKGRQRARGQQPGTRGHGRRKYDSLEARATTSDMPEDEKHCPKCELPFEAHGSVTSETIEIEVRAHRRVHHRRRYRATCSCPGVPATVTAAPPAKVIPRGLLGVSVWVHILLDKFHYQRPTNRLLADLRTLGLDLAPGTITGGLQQLGALFEPLSGRIRGRCLESNRWFADETRWSVFEPIEGKEGHRWYFWVIGSPEVVVYLLDPSRASRVVKDFFGDDASGILNVDRYSAYKSLSKEQQLIVLAFCWVHMRRDFVRVATGWPELAGWAEAWVEAINELFALNRERLEVLDDPKASPEAAEVAIARLGAHLDYLQEGAEAELAGNPEEAQRKPLQSLQNHWPGLTVFMEHPEVPMDNNRAERKVRPLAVARKNYYGSGSVWSGQLAAMLFSILQTLEMRKINVRHWLTAYLQACAEAGGKPPEDLDPWLPWEMDEARRAFLSQPLPPPPAAGPDTS